MLPCIFIGLFSWYANACNGCLMSIATNKTAPLPSGSVNKSAQEILAAGLAVIKRADRTMVGLISAAVVLLAVVAWPVLAWWRYAYFESAGYYAHAPIIPFIVALMFWYRREDLRRVPLQPTLAALPIVCLSLGLLIFAGKRDVLAVGSAAFLICLWSSVWLLLGTSFVRAAAFPLGFLILMSPLPGPLLNDATQGIQMLSTHIANQMLHAMTFGTTQVGNVITMDSFVLFVDVPCSGFKTLMAMTTFSAAFAYLVDGPRLKRLLLFLISMPLAVLVNSLRIAMIGVVGDCVSAPAAHKFHDWSGVIMLILGFVVLFSLAKVFGCRKFAGLPIF
jgi:exosortase